MLRSVSCENTTVSVHGLWTWSQRKLDYEAHIYTIAVNCSVFIITWNQCLVFFLCADLTLLFMWLPRLRSICFCVVNTEQLSCMYKLDFVLKKWNIWNDLFLQLKKKNLLFPHSGILNTESERHLSHTIWLFQCTTVTDHVILFCSSLLAY